MPNYKDLPQELTRTRTNEAVSELVDLKVHTATDIEAQEVSKEQAKDMYKTMWDIRNFEENARRFFAVGQIPGFVHLYAGEEAVAAGVCANLTDKDYITSTHRGHGHCVAKGGDLKGMMAEIFGKETGLGKGKGGSMHIADLDKGILGANGMVGGGFGLATGAAMRNKYLKTDDVAVCFFGDGAANEGLFHECLNMASIWKLPVVFVNENNLFAESTPQWYSSASATIAERALAYDMPGVRVNGKDLFAVYQVAKEAVERARSGQGPTLIEAVTYRDHGHFEGDEQKYKAPDGEEKDWADVDPLEVFRNYTVEHELLTEEELDEILEESKKDVDDAIKYAQDSPIPKAESLLEDVFAE
ncbi:thiamine pyrophosphate-dependent dehydrogenase E1 component subunit alpha [Streptococcus mutans]|uniref:thiamine pyrophosphate-dependent dehydrogenase E1 component subunit alpha n=1 Tax=Streptococcus mutans TaxID=1309 RepID=UPI0028E3DB51|nr:thiamine pyrophosphate-dependent dehydrogenase E1 component subunit alpha [Streptococcus mutans]MDT9537530.1 thiamine pyrophosphate-dependent dehydrogenase E1 component subunit alpha [Streptococcus mutans]